MRILNFQKKWPKLNNSLLFTSFRYARRDKDWQVEEVVRVCYRTRFPDREELGVARIIRIDERDMSKRWSPYATHLRPNTEDTIPPWEAAEDGFYGMHGSGNVEKMREFIRQPGRGDIVNKLTLYWIERSNA